MRQKITVPVKRVPVNMIPDIVYAQKPFWYGHSSRTLKLTLIRPQNKYPLPLIIWLCGGAWKTMEKSYHLPEMFHLAERGFAVASVEYRTTNECSFPCQIEDIKDAIRFLRAHADRYNLDPLHFGLMGESAGGYLAAFVGASGSTRVFDTGEYQDQSSAVQAVCDWYGPSDFFDLFKNNNDYLCSSEMLFLGGDGVDLQKQAAVADPCTYFSLETPPFLILHGNNDHKVSLRQSERLYERIVDNGTIVNFYEIDGAEHGSYHFAQPAIQQLIANFFSQYLKD